MSFRLSLMCLPFRAKLQTASEQGSLWLIESSLKYNIISHIHELVLYIKYEINYKMLLIKMHQYISKIILHKMSYNNKNSV